MSQYAFPLTLPPVFSEDNFFVSASNEAAHGWVTRWPDWTAHSLIIYGAPGSGKTHLGHIWAARAQAEVLAAPAPQVNGNALLEQIETLSDERALLHLINYSRENKHYLLLTASAAPKELPFRLPDLTSRLLAMPAVSIALADDAVLAASLRKQFSDRQLKVEEDVIAYLLPRMERSFAHIKAAVDELDKQALAQQKNITVPFVKRVMGY